MKYSLNNLNKSIDRWITKKIFIAPDKNYTESFLREQYSSLVNDFDGFKNFAKNPHFQTTYHKYKIGDFSYSEKLFSNDDDLMSSYFDENLREKLVKEKKIKLIILKEGKKKINKLSIIYRYCSPYI